MSQTIAPTPPPTLNQGQQETADAYFSFLMSPDRYFAISGPAGVGKTFMMNYLSDAGLQTYEDACKLVGIQPEYREVHFTATTNKAAEVLEQSIGKRVQTIHSFLGLKVQENYSNGTTSVTRTGNCRVRRHMVVFIDECSMLDTRMMQEIEELFENAKIVFVGDDKQMAPVGEDTSPAFAAVAPENFAVLTEPVRNSGQPALMALCQQLRETVETGIFKPILGVPGVIDYLDDSNMPHELAANFTALNPSARVLNYTNERATQYNDFIRGEVRGLPYDVCVGDTYVVAQAYQNGTRSYSVERELTVEGVSEVLEDFAWSNLTGGKPILYRRVNFGDAIDPDDIPDVRVALDRGLVNHAIKALARTKNWSAYFELKAIYLDVRDKASCTVYKSQGSTYDTAFIDLGNLGTCFDAQQVARMLYVAVSRARSRICFYGRLPSRYHDSQGVPLWTIASGLPALQTSSSPVISVV
jgi:hypothetical protein